MVQMEIVKGFPDGDIRADNVGFMITIRPQQYASNDLYCVQRMITWYQLFSIEPNHCRNRIMLTLLNALYDEYDFLNGREKKNGTT